MKKHFLVGLSTILCLLVLTSIASPVSANDLKVESSVAGFTERSFSTVSSWIDVTNTARYTVEIDSVALVIYLTSGNITYTYFSGVYNLQPGEHKIFNYLIDYGFPTSDAGDHPASIIIAGYGSNDLFGNLYIFNTTFTVLDSTQSSSAEIWANSIFSSPLTMPLIIAVIAVIVVVAVFTVMKKKKKLSTNLPQHVVTVPPQQIASQDDYKFCPKCGKPLSGEHLFCPFCGYKKP